MTTMLLISALTSNVLTTKAADSTVIINPEYEHQTFKGWGTSLSWWGNAIGGWQNTTKQNEILDLLYDENVGLGLNVARYNIGGGDDSTHTHMRNGANLEGYQPSPGVWNYNADATQRYILNEAIDRALELSHKITDDVENLQPETWVYWQAVEEEFNVNNWGFIHASFDGTENYEVTKQYYGMANYSKFIRPGSTIIGVSDSNMLVALNKNSHKLTIVVINDTSSSNNYTIDLSKFATVGSTTNVYRTSSSENLVQLDNINIRIDQYDYHAYDNQQWKFETIY